MADNPCCHLKVAPDDPLPKLAARGRQGLPCKSAVFAHRNGSPERVAGRERGSQSHRGLRASMPPNTTTMDADLWLCSFEIEGAADRKIYQVTHSSLNDGCDRIKMLLPENGWNRYPPCVKIVGGTPLGAASGLRQRLSNRYDLRRETGAFSALGIAPSSGGVVGFGTAYPGEGFCGWR